jgi:hypothetical protein
MNYINKLRCESPIDFAAEELRKYLRMMMPDGGNYHIKYAPEATEGFKLGLMQDFGLDVSDAEDTELDDILYIDCDESGGIIAGSNPRSVLLAVYEYFRQMGCRWLFPGVDGEYIPLKDITPVKYRFKPSMRYRGQCNEGAEFQQCMLDAIDFSPKVGLNVFMMEFKIPNGYYDFYYDHVNNENNRQPEPVTPEQVLQWKRQCEAEISKRGLQFHDIGHGWAANSFGIDTSSEFVDDSKISDEAREFLALRNGKRGIFNGRPHHTEFCMSNTVARKKVVSHIVDYAEKHDNVDYLHVWLADARNNHCECDECCKRTPSDWYILMMNELDKALCDAELSTRIVFIVYTDTTFAPLTEYIKNQPRFTLLIAPITRSFTQSLPLEISEDLTVPEYKRNDIILPSKVEEYFVHLNNWKKTWKGSCIAYEYHFWRHQYYDLSGINIARVVNEDVKAYAKHNIQGIIEDGSQRSFFPNGFAFYCYARTLFDISSSYDDLLEDYFRIAYGERWREFYNYLEKISETIDFKLVEQERSIDYSISRFYNPTEADKLHGIRDVTSEGLKLIRENYNHQNRITTFSVRLLEMHAEYCKLFADAMMFKAKGMDQSAWEKFNLFRDTIGKYEAEYQGVYDHGLAMNSLKNNVFSLKTNRPESVYM